MTSWRKLRQQIAGSAGQLALTSFGDINNVDNIVSVSVLPASASSSSPSAVAIAYPFLKWAGGKRQLLPKLSALAPKQIERYFEPFLGGGAFFFYLMSNGKINSSAFISDINPDLISAYTVIRDDCETLINLLLQYNEIEYDEKLFPKKPAGKQGGYYYKSYYKLRDEYNSKSSNRVTYKI